MARPCRIELAAATDFPRSDVGPRPSAPLRREARAWAGVRTAESAG